MLLHNASKISKENLLKKNMIVEKFGTKHIYKIISKRYLKDYLDLIFKIKSDKLENLNIFQKMIF